MTCLKQGSPACVLGQGKGYKDCSISKEGSKKVYWLTGCKMKIR